MKRAFSSFAPAVTVLGLVFCCNCSSGGGGGTTSGTSGTGSGSSSGQSDGSYTIIKLDGTAEPQSMFCTSISPTGQIGVAYFLSDAGQTAMRNNWLPMYTEVNGMASSLGPSAITVAPSLVRPPVQFTFGCSVAFQPSGLAAVGLFGGTDYNGTAADSGPTGSLYWLQSQAELDYRQSDGTFLRDICMESSTGGQCQVATPANASCPVSNDATDNGFDWTIDYNGTVDMSAEQLCNNPFGEIVGSWPTLLFDGGTAVMAFRDVHEGQFPIQDWGASDTKMCIGGPAAESFSYSAPVTISAAGDNQHSGFGVHNEMVFGPSGKLAIVGDVDPKDEGEEVSGSGPVSFTMQTGLNTQSTADWTAPMDPFDPSGTHPLIQQTGSGPSLSYDSSNGFGIAAVDTSLTVPALYYTSSTDGKDWTPAVTIAQLGSQGFFPDLTVDPNGNPIVSYIVCSQQDGYSPDKACDQNSAELDTIEDTAAGWGDAVTILPGGFWHPRMGYLPNGKQVFIYSDMFNGGLYVAIQK